MKAEKLPSGRWRVRVPIGEVDGKRKWKSITADTKHEALRQARMYDHTVLSGATAGRLQDLVARYIEIKEPVLSPSTVKEYRKMADKHINGSRLGLMDVVAIRTSDMQKWVSALSVEVSPKTVRNVYGLVSATYSMFMPDMHLHVKMPQKVKVRTHTPESVDVSKLFDYFREKDDRDMLIACYLSAHRSLRRGEICALTMDDISDDEITIDKAMVKTSHGEWVIKPPKTDSSNRVVPMCADIVPYLPASGHIVGITPDVITNRFAKAVKKIGCEHFRFHDLRHYWCTMMLYSGVPGRIVQDLGGWETDRVMKSVYEGVLSVEKKKHMEEMDKIFRVTNVSQED